MTHNAEAKRIFTSAVRGSNIMTPNVLGYYTIKNGAAEVTSGRGFDREPIYGVTVVKDGKHNHDLSKCLHSMDGVDEYIKTL